MIINPVNFPVFDKEIVDMESNHNVRQCLLRNSKFNGHVVKWDLTGTRINIYNDLIGIGNTIKRTLLLLLSGYNATSKKINAGILNRKITSLT